MKKKLKILYEDKYLLVVEKDAGLLTISNSKEKVNTLYHQVSDYLKSKNTKVFIVHRLDKDTSGLIVFAKSEKIKRELQDNWKNVVRKYYGIVNGKINKDHDVIESYLTETKTYYVYKTSSKYGKLAITEYQKLNSNDKYSLLDITIHTGRKHQIRVQLNDINYPLVGDKTYSKIKSTLVKRLCLHAYYLEFIHPVTKEVLKIQINYPEEFNKLIKNVS